MRSMKLAAVALAGALAALPAAAAETVVWWDFLAGGDGVRMKALLDKFNQEHEGEIAIEASTLQWGVPYYTKVQTSVAVDEAPDIMTYHSSRFPLAVSQGLLQEITPGRLGGDGPQPGRLRPCGLGRHYRRRQAVRRAARYSPDRALL